MNFRRLLSLLLCMMMFAVMPVSAQADDTAADTGIIDAQKLNEMTESFLSERGIDSKDFSLGFCYTATGDEWYYNGDEWFYPASMYKVPLMMLLSERVKSGEITQDTYIYDKPVSEIEELVLVYSNNEWAHYIRTYLGGDEQWRTEAKKYASLEDGEYDPDYMDYCYFNNRYMTSVMKTLYSDSDSYPNIIDCLLRAEPTHYFRLSQSIEGVYDVAQKYGSFDDQLGQSFNHTTGIIYTPNPCIVTVMTCNVSNYEKVISDAALMLTEYALDLDDQLKSYEEEKQAEADAARKAEEEAAAQEAEQERLAAEREAEEKAEQERLAAEQARKATIKKVLTVAGIAAAVVLAVFIGTRIVLKRRRPPRRAPRPQDRYAPGPQPMPERHAPEPQDPPLERHAPKPQQELMQDRHAPRGGGGYKPKH